MSVGKKGLIIFDLDGTIADTLYSITEAVNMCMQHYGFPLKSYTEVRAAVGGGAKKLIMQTMPEKEAQNPEKAEAIYKYFQSCYDRTHNHINGCYPGMHKTILELYSRGYALAVLSNKPDAYVKNIIGGLFAGSEIAIAMGETDFPKKPDPTAALYIADKLGIDVKDCAFIGDSDVDVQTAHNSHMLSVAVSWGYRDRDMLVACKPDHIADTPYELLDIFK